MCGKLCGNGSSERLPIRDDILRIDASGLPQVFQSSFGIPIQPFFARRFASPITSVLDRKNIRRQRAQHLIDVGTIGDI
jgi:hypothetical protein